jgi:hypothetical protein
MDEQGEGSTAGPTPDAAREALARVRELLDAWVPGMTCDRPRLRGALGVPLADASREPERLFALGWLEWLEGNPGAAEPLLAGAVRRAREAANAEILAEAAYWCARVRQRLGKAEALAEYEAVLRTLGGSPRATAWFVDLLWRAGRVDRAEQVWKPLRGNRRVAACPEAPLLEARVLLRRGETGSAERLLNEAAPAGGVVEVERLLLLAWAAFTTRQIERGRALLSQARDGPYPAAALDAWSLLCERRAAGEGVSGGEVEAPPALADFLRGQEARLAGDDETAAAAYRAALGLPAAQPFARYALACLGQDDFAAVLAAQPGLFLAVRCRLRLTLERFRRRQASPAEYLDAFAQAASAGYRDAADHFHRLASALAQRQPSTESLRSLATGGPDFARAALELAVCRLPAAGARELLLEWALEGSPAIAAGLGPEVGRQLLRLLLLARAGGQADPGDEARAVAGRLLPGDPLLALAGIGLPSADGTGEAVPPVRLLRLAEAPAGEGVADEAWLEEVRRLRGHERFRSLAQALLAWEAARRGDACALATFLDEGDLWRGFSAGPPGFVLRAVAAAVAAQPTHPGPRRSLGRWLSLWEPGTLGSVGAGLAAHAGTSPPRAAGAEPPPGLPAAPWFSHQASRALGRDDPTEALAFVRRALAADAGVGAAVREALPELERRAGARGLAALFRNPGEPPPASGLLADAVDLLGGLPEGRALLDAAGRGETASAREALASLAALPELPPRLAHHLALLEQRAAQSLEEAGRHDEAEPHRRRAWGHWLRFLAAAPAEGGPPARARGLLLDWLLTGQRHRIGGLLARNAVDEARRAWDLVQGLAGHALEGEDLAGRVARFRDELATEYLLSTREAMRFGAVPEGWRADYEKGLGLLRRLLSLDRDNVRLLTALAEVSAEWFFDLYHLGDAPALRAQVERFTPFALQLARLVEGRPGDLAARAALADFCTFRGFVGPDRARKAALYREALRFNPAADNARSLLAELEGGPRRAGE